MQENNLQRPSKGLHTDMSLGDQPKDTYRFALNAVNETELGDLNFLSNEESNEICGVLPQGYVPIGRIYLVDNQIAVFSVSQDETISEIGILDNNCTYTTHVNDVDSLEGKKLNFKISHQIQGTYRLRRGCERTVYWVDGDNNKPRYYNFDKVENFQTGGVFDANKFELDRSYSSIPLFEDVVVQNSGGQLEPGSYNVAIQYLDEDLNPTEWITTSPIAYVYNDDTTEEFLDIRGSINSDTDYIDFPTTDKSIKVTLADLDETFLFYRLAFIEATNGSGQVSAVKYTENIPTSKDFFIYTGTNFSTLGTEEEILAFNQIISSAEHIEQIENRLILANVKGKQVNFCELQKYASRIKTDMITKKVFANVISEGNTKNPTVNFEAAGYMPGEIYSFGVVYIFADGSLSPVYHIPGKNPNVDNNVVFTPGDNVYAMKNNNASLNNTYIDNSNCGAEDYWGIDSEGEFLKNQPVRHHRFPLRSEANLDLVVEESMSSTSTLNYQVKLTGVGTITLPCSQEDFDNGDCSPQQDAPPFQARVTYTVDGVTETLTVNIDPQNESNPFEIEELSNFYTSNNITIVSIEESNDTGGTTDVTGGGTSPKGISYSAEVIDAEFTSESRLYSTEVYGIQFSGVDLPPASDTNGEEIVGYYIVRNERGENEKTILDSAVLNPSVVNSKYTSHGLIAPEFDNDDRLSKKVFGLIHPEHKFYDKKYNEVTEIIQEGTFDVIDRKKSKSRYRDVQDGTSFDSDVHKGGGGNDSDGWSLKAITRDNILSYKREYLFNKVSDDIENIFYLDALESRGLEEDTITSYNISGDNKVGMIHLKDDYTESMRNTLPYVYLKRDISDSYSTFRTLPYYKASVNPEYSATTSVFGGDTFITPMRYSNTIFWDNRIAERAGRTSVWNYIVGGILVLVGAVLTFFTVGASTIVIAAGVAIIGGGALFIASGVKRDALVRAYSDEYDKGLRETALDNWTSYEYQGLPCQGYGRTFCDTPEDDEIEWIGDCATDLWFESQVNISLRNGFFVDTPTFIDAPGKIETGNDFIESAYEHFDVFKQRDVSIYPFTELDKHIMSKLSTFDVERKDNRLYIGHPLGDYYSINPDYNRINSQKIFFHLGIEYDCCSDCQEEFPHRVHYSEQSFQEELTDNYRVFLPNNYRDIEGEKGEITNLYRFYNNLYIHTEEALWHLPQNYQERVTNDIVSFIGTGSYFETPPRLVVDDSVASAGTRHKWGATKTKHGILFPSQIEDKWYLFDGNKLKALSDYGKSNWFKENMSSKVAQEYYNSNGRPYPFLNNPSNPVGEGFISTYDTKKERFIITKKDFSLNSTLIGMTDYEICISNGVVTVFENYNQTIAAQELLGLTYVGIQDCRMVFKKTELQSVDEIRYEEVVTPVVTTIPDPTSEPIISITYGGNCNSVICNYTVQWTDSNNVLQSDTLITDQFESKTIDINECVKIGSVSMAGAGSFTTVQGGPPCETTTTVDVITYEPVVYTINTQVEVLSFIDGIPLVGDLVNYNNSWTMSYSLKNNSWTSYHSYMPNMYMYVSEKFYSWRHGNSNFWKHNKRGEYQTFYGEYFPHIIEYVSLANPVQTKIWNHIRLLTEAKIFSPTSNEYVDERFATFNKAVLYNSRQCSGEMNLVVKDTQNNQVDYLMNQTVNPNDNSFIIDRNERDWTLNDLRDIRIDYTTSIWNSNINSVQDDYFIDKILNVSTLNVNKDWTQLESFRDKYLVVRLIFDNFANTKLLTNYTVENEQQSFR